MVVNANVIVATYIKCMKENLIALKHQYNIFYIEVRAVASKKLTFFFQVYAGFARR